MGTFDANGYGIHDIGGNLREWTWDWYDDRTYDYEWKEDFPKIDNYWNDYNGSYDLVDLNASTSIHYYHQNYGPSKYIAGMLGDTSFKRTYSNYTWEMAHELVFDEDANVSAVAVALSNKTLTIETDIRIQELKSNLFIQTVQHKPQVINQQITDTLLQYLQTLSQQNLYRRLSLDLPKLCIFWQGSFLLWHDCNWSLPKSGVPYIFNPKYPL